MTQEECPFRSSKVLHDGQGDFHLCNREGGDCECIPSGCPYLIAKNSKLNLPDLPGYVQIDNKEGKKSEIPTSLEEAAKEYMKKARKHLFDDSPIGRADDAFIAGAEWQKGQMMKDAVEAKIYGYDDGSFELIASWLDMPKESKFKDGDKVKIIIVKK